MRTGDGDQQSLDNNDGGGNDDDDDAEVEELNLKSTGDYGTDESDLDLLLDGVRDPIDRLYKVSTKIRNPSSRLGSSRAVNYQQIDEETGVDFLRAIEQTDHDHIRSLFLQYQKARALQECDTVEPPKNLVGGEDDDGVWEPIRTVLAQHRAADSFLIGRIARANVRRRQHFAYRKMHREKLAHHARASISTQSGLTSGIENPSHPSFDRHVSNDSFIPQAELAPPAASVTTATKLNLSRLELGENQSTFTVSEYAPSTWQPARDAVAFPPPPTTQSGEKFFECPYCFTLCPRGALAAKAWKWEEPYKALTNKTKLMRATEPILSTISALMSVLTRIAGIQTNCTTTATTGNTTRTRAIGRFGVVRSTRVKHSTSWRCIKIIFATNTLIMLTMHRRIGSSVPVNPS